MSAVCGDFGAVTPHSQPNHQACMDSTWLKQLCQIQFLSKIVTINFITGAASFVRMEAWDTFSRISQQNWWYDARKSVSFYSSERSEGKIKHCMQRLNFSIFTFIIFVWFFVTKHVANERNLSIFHLKWLFFLLFGEIRNFLHNFRLLSLSLLSECPHDGY